jgi:hypothetical protein
MPQHSVAEKPKFYKDKKNILLEEENKNQHLYIRNLIPTKSEKPGMFPI